MPNRAKPDFVSVSTTRASTGSHLGLAPGGLGLRRQRASTAVHNPDHAGLGNSVAGLQIDGHAADTGRGLQSPTSLPKPMFLRHPRRGFPGNAPVVDPASAMRPGPTTGTVSNKTWGVERPAATGSRVSRLTFGQACWGFFLKTAVDRRPRCKPAGAQTSRESRSAPSFGP